jgi:ankyrin repeat protein
MHDEIENATEKAEQLISRMQKYGPDCSIKFIKKPHRLDLKFEKSFAMAVKKNKNEILELFPMQSIKTAYCSVHQLKDYKQYKDDKDKLKEQYTTPLHLACQNSNIEAVRILIEQQKYDVNVLLNDKNFLVELLQNSGYMDFSIMNMIFKKRKPQINSGKQLALNQAILRGNPFMIKTLLELGNPNPFVRDKQGKGPIHIAAAKLDRETFEALIRKGADPMMPDADGNTFLHIMAMGTIKDKEYDFIKAMVVRHGLRLTRNKENRTAHNLIKANSAQGILLRGQPNFKRKIGEWFDQKIEEKPTFIDQNENTPMHLAIIEDDLARVRSLIYQLDSMSGKITPEVMALLETRNKDGHTAFFTAVLHDRNEIADFILDTYPGVD